MSLSLLPDFRNVFALFHFISCLPKLSPEKEEEPKFRETFRPKILYPGSSLNLKCSAIGSPMPQIRWFFYSESLSDFTTSTASGSSSSSSSSPSSSAAAVAGPHSALNLINHYHHASTSSSSSSSSILITTSSSSSSRGSGKGNRGSRIRIADYVTESGDIVSHLNMSIISTEDSGLYSCEAISELSVRRHSAMIQVYGAPTVHPLSNISITSGGKLSLDCPVSGYPITEIKWRKGQSVKERQIEGTNHCVQMSSFMSLHSLPHPLAQPLPPQKL